MYTFVYSIASINCGPLFFRAGPPPPSMSAPPPPSPPNEITVRASIHAPPASSQGPPTSPKPSSDSGSDYGSPNYVSRCFNCLAEVL